jgi:hypothetical protein
MPGTRKTFFSNLRTVASWDKLFLIMEEGLGIALEPP